MVILLLLLLVCHINLSFESFLQLNGYTAIKDLLCVIEKDDSSCDLENLHPIKRKILKENALPDLYIKMNEYNESVPAMFRTLSFHAGLSYLKALNKEVYVLHCDHSGSFLCRRSEDESGTAIYYRPSHNDHLKIDLEQKNGKYFLKYDGLKKFLRFEEIYNADLPTIVLPKMPSVGTYSLFADEIKFLGQLRFLVHSQMEMQHVIPETNNIVMYNIFECLDKMMLETCTKFYYHVEVFKELSAYDVLCHFSKILLKNPHITDTRSRITKYDMFIISKYMFIFCKKLLFVVYPNATKDGKSERSYDDILNSLNIYGSEIIKLTRKSFVKFAPRSWEYSLSNDQKFPILVICGPNILRCEILTSNIFIISQEVIRHSVMEKMAHFINKIEYQDFRIKETRRNILCYDILGDCYDLFQYAPLQYLYDNLDRNEKDEYYRMTKNIVVKVYYMIWSVISLKTLRLYESFINSIKESGLLNYIGLNLSDVQLMRVNCLQLNDECNKENIFNYPTIKIIFPEKGKISFMYKGDPLDTEQLLQFIINSDINPFWYSKWKYSEKKIFDIISSFYENILVVGLWQDLELHVRTNCQNLFLNAEQDTFIMVIDVETPPSFLKDIFLLDLKTKSGMFMVNIKHLLIKEIIISEDFYDSLTSLNDALTTILAPITLKRLQTSREAHIPIFVVFYYTMDFSLTSILRDCHRRLSGQFSFNHVNIWQNYKMFQLFEEYKCPGVPCFSVFNYTENVYTLLEGEHKLQNATTITSWLESIINGRLSPEVRLNKLPKMEVYYKFNYADSYDSQKSIFESIKMKEAGARGRSKKPDRETDNPRTQPTYVEREL